jgi:hypothetical protein
MQYINLQDMVRTPENYHAEEEKEELSLDALIHIKRSLKQTLWLEEYERETLMLES